jgi:hypothetical protein
VLRDVARSLERHAQIAARVVIDVALDEERGVLVDEREQAQQPLWLARGLEAAA